MSETDHTGDPRKQIANGLALVVMGLLALGLLAADVSWWWIAFPIGGGLIPLANGLAAWYGEETDDGADARQDALDELRSRYARGELAEPEFEARLERLLETETVEDARRSLERTRTPKREQEANWGK